MKKLFRVLCLFIVIGAIVFIYINRNKILLNLYKLDFVLRQPCGMFFADTLKPWDEVQKAGVISACRIYKKSGVGAVFLSPLYVFLGSGTSGAFATKDTITFDMAGVDDAAAFTSVALHEMAHVIDQRLGNLSSKLTWLYPSGWSCSNLYDLNSCTNSCKQTAEKSFYCSYKMYETLPSRYGTPGYDPDHTDVSTNPAEDFAESARYFIQANDALNMTSPSRCEYFKELLKALADNPCYDCNANTACINP